MLDIKLKFFIVIILSIILFYINRKNPTGQGPGHSQKQPTNTSSAQVTNEIQNATTQNNTITKIETINATKKQETKPKLARKRPKEKKNVCDYFEHKMAEFNRLISQAAKRSLFQKNAFKTGCKSDKRCQNDDGTDKKQINPGVVWCVVGLLLISLIAAIVDFVVTKTNAMKKQNSIDASGKPGTLTRRCSLASLTVSRHERRQAFASRRASTIVDGQSKKLKDSSALNTRNHPTRVKFVT